MNQGDVTRVTSFCQRARGPVGQGVGPFSEARRLRIHFFPAVAVNLASATHTLVAMAMSWTLTHSSGP